MGVLLLVNLEEPLTIEQRQQELQPLTDDHDVIGISPFELILRAKAPMFVGDTS